MARKKLSVDSRTHKDHHPLKSSKDPSPDSKMENLKTLNQLLLKETMEKRFQIENLKSEIEELNQEKPLLSGLEREISRLVISSAVAEEIVKLGFLVKERDDIKQGMEDAVAERDASREEVGLRWKEIWELEARVRALETQNVGIGAQLEAAVAEREEVERKARKNEEVFESLREVMETEREEMGERHREETEANAEKVSALEGELWNVVEAKGRLEVDVGTAKAAIHTLNVEKEELRSEFADLEKRNGNLKGEIDGLREKVGVLEEEKEELTRSLETQTRVSALELNETRVKIGEIEQEKKQLSLGIVELEKRNGELKWEVDKLLVNVDVLGKEKEEAEMSFEARIRKYELELNSLGEKMAVTEQAKDEIEQEKANLEIEILELKKGVTKLLVNVDVLGKEKEEAEKSFETRIRESELELNSLGEKMAVTGQAKTEIEKEKVNLEIEILELKNEVTKLQANVDVLGKEKEETEKSFEARIRESELELNSLGEKMAVTEHAKDEIEQEKANLEIEILELKKKVTKLLVDVDVLGKEKEEMEKSFNARIREFELELNSLGEKNAVTEQAKDEIQQEKANLEIEILKLKKEVTKLNSTILELQELSVKYTEKNNQLQADRDATQRVLDVQREEAGSLKLQIEELLKSRDGTMEKLKKLQISFDSLVSEKEEGERNIKLLLEEKALLEKSLSAAQANSKELERKMKAAVVTSEKALSLLKSTAEAMNGSEKAREIGTTIDDDADIRPFVGKIESIKKAYKNRVAKIDEMNQELVVMKSAVDDARKKGGLRMWLYPAATTFLAAISFAYASRVR